MGLGEQERSGLKGGNTKSDGSIQDMGLVSMQRVGGVVGGMASGNQFRIWEIEATDVDNTFWDPFAHTRHIPLCFYPGCAGALPATVFKKVYNLWVKTNVWGRCTTHFRTYFSDWDVHRGYGILTHGHIAATD